MPNFGQQLKAARKAAKVTQVGRKAAKVTQKQLAAAMGVKVATVTSWERDPEDKGHRNPERDHVIAAGNALRLATPALNEWLEGLGYHLEPDERTIPLFDRRKPLAVIQEECDSYSWPCLAMNEDFEAVAWNAAANDLSELDFATDLAEPGARNLLRMAVSKHYRNKLANWEDVLTIGMSMYKNGGHDFFNPQTLTPYQQSLVDYLIANHIDDLEWLMKLWAKSPAHSEGMHSAFEARWRSSDGTALRFHCAFTSWSDFDATGGFDWHPAEAATWRWLAAHPYSPAPQVEVETPPALPPAAMSAGELLRYARKRQGLTQVGLAAESGRSEGLIAAIESGTKALTRRTAIAVGRALDLDRSTLNAILDAVQQAPEPSEQFAYIIGHPIQKSGRRYAELAGGRVHWSEFDIAREIDTYEWPVIVVDGRCEVIATNERCRAAIGLDVRGRPPGPTRNLVAIVTDSWFRESVEDWETVVTKIWPDELAIFASPPDGERPTMARSYFRSVLQHIHEREAAARLTKSVLGELNALWEAAPDHRLATRIVFPLRWVRGRAPLTFNVVVSPWNHMIDPYWAIDLHPADAETWGEGFGVKLYTRRGNALDAVSH